MKMFKKIFVNMVAILLVCVSCLSLTACKADIKKMEITISVYNYEEESVGFEDVTLTVDLYRHLAKNTVDTIIGYAKEGYYDGSVFYKMSKYSTQIMMGDIKVNTAGDVELKDVKPEIKGEFESAGTVGSNLTNVKGAIGLWRTWYSWDNSYKNTDSSMGTGRATWYMPTEAISGYNGYFCVFAKINLNDEANSDALEKIIAATQKDTDTYTVYYTGDYDSSNADGSYGLNGNCVLKSQFDKDEIDNLYESDEDKLELVGYNYYDIEVPVTATGDVAVKITSIKIK